MTAVREQLGTATLLYRFKYSNVKSSVQVARPSIRSRDATVRGTLVLRATERRSGKATQDTYRGTVFLKRVNFCNWKVAGYKQD